MIQPSSPTISVDDLRDTSAVLKETSDVMAAIRKQLEWFVRLEEFGTETEAGQRALEKVATGFKSLVSRFSTLRQIATDIHPDCFLWFAQIAEPGTRVQLCGARGSSFHLAVENLVDQYAAVIDLGTDPIGQFDNRALLAAMNVIDPEAVSITLQQELSRAIQAIPNHRNSSDGSTRRKKGRDPLTDDRDKWIYDLMSLDSTITWGQAAVRANRESDRLSKKWGRLSGRQAAKKSVDAYASTHLLPQIIRKKA